MNLLLIQFLAILLLLNYNVCEQRFFKECKSSCNVHVSVVASFPSFVEFGKLPVFNLCIKLSLIAV